MTSLNYQRALLEVERKFSRLRCYPLTIDGGTPAFQSLVKHQTIRFRDIYFDNDKDSLSKAGTWLRQRDGLWQSKIRVPHLHGGRNDHTNSQFREVMDHDAITKHVSKILLRKSTENSDLKCQRRDEQPSFVIANAFGLPAMADITTIRESWTADSRFKIVLDTTDFGHVVGEVELEEEHDHNHSPKPPMPVFGHHSPDEDTVLSQCSAAMDLELRDFMKRYHWAFEIGRPVGKLTAYFAFQSQPK